MAELRDVRAAGQRIDPAFGRVFDLAVYHAGREEAWRSDETACHLCGSAGGTPSAVPSDPGWGLHWCPACFEAFWRPGWFYRKHLGEG